jgi:hypothetical protein
MRRIEIGPPLVRQGARNPIEMPEFGLRCLVGDLYRGTPLDPHRQGPVA